MWDLQGWLAAVGSMSPGAVFAGAGSFASIASLYCTLRVRTIVRGLDEHAKGLADTYLCLSMVQLPASHEAPQMTLAGRVVEKRKVQRLCDARSLVKNLLRDSVQVALDHEDNHYLKMAQRFFDFGAVRTALSLFERAELLHDEGSLKMTDKELKRCLRGIERCRCALWEVEEVIAMRREHSERPNKSQGVLGPPPQTVIEHLDLRWKCVSRAAWAYLRASRTLFGSRTTVVVFRAR